MADKEFRKPDIIRTEDFEVKAAEKNTYGDLIVTSALDVSYKVGNKRTHLFPIFQPGVSVHVSYASFMNKEYIADAVKSGQVIKSETSKPPIIKQELTPPARGQKSTEERSSIERQVCLKCACEVRAGKSDSEILQTAEAFSKWFYSGIIPPEKGTEAELHAKIEGALEEIDPLNWQVVRPMWQKLMSDKKKGWTTTTLIFTTLKGLGANPESKTLEAAYESLNDRGKKQFIDLVKAETPSRLIAEAEKIAEEG